MLRVVGKKATQTQPALPLAQASVVGQAGDGEASGVDKVDPHQLQESRFPGDRCLEQDFHVQPEVGEEVVAQTRAPGALEQSQSFRHFSLRYFAVPQVGGPAGIVGGRWQAGPRQVLDAGQQREGKVSLLLFESKELAESSQVHRGRQQLGHVSEADARASGNCRDAVSPPLHPRAKAELEKTGHEIAEQQHVIVAGTVEAENLIAADDLQQLRLQLPRQSLCPRSQIEINHGGRLLRLLLLPLTSPSVKLGPLVVHHSQSGFSHDVVEFCVVAVAVAVVVVVVVGIVLLLLLLCFLSLLLFFRIVVVVAAVVVVATVL